MTNPDRVLKSRDITLPTKVCVVKAMVFPAVTYGCESYTINPNPGIKPRSPALQADSLPPEPQGKPKERETRDQIANICWIIEKAREFQKSIYHCFTLKL